MLVQKPVYFRGFEYQIEVGREESYADIRERCLTKIMNSNATMKNPDSFDVLVMPTSHATLKDPDTVDYFQTVQRQTHADSFNCTEDSLESCIREFFVKCGEKECYIKIVDDSSLRILLQKICDNINDSLEIENIASVYQVENGELFLYKRDDPDRRDLRKTIQDSNVRDLPIFVTTANLPTSAVPDVQVFRVRFLDHEEKLVRVHREDSLKTFFEKFRDAFGDAFPVHRVAMVFQTMNQETKYIYNINDSENRNLKKTIEYCSQLIPELPLYVSLGPNVVQPNVVQNTEILEYEVRLDREQRTVRVLPEDSLRTFFEKAHDAFDGELPAENITSMFQENNAERTYFYQVSEPRNNDVRRTIEHCSELTPNLPVIITIGAAPIVPADKVLEYKVQYRNAQRLVRVLSEDSLRTFFEKIRDAFDGELPVEKITSMFQELNSRRKYFYNVEDHSNRDIRRSIEDCTLLNQRLPVIVTLGAASLFQLGEIKEYKVEYQGEQRTVRVLPEDSLRTFFEKARDAFDGELPAENITSMFQVLNAERTYFYNVDRPQLDVIKRTIEHCSELNTNLPVMLTFRETPEPQGGEGDLFQLQVEFQHEQRPVRVLPEDSLRTFFEKARDAFDGELPVENIAAAYQVVNRERRFIYKADDPDHQDLRMPIKDCIDPATDLPILLIFRQDLSDPWLHLHLGDGNYKRVAFNPNDKLLDIVSAHGSRRPAPADLRLKSRSLYNKLGRIGAEISNTTVGMCGLSPGDIVEVIEEDRVDHCQFFLCKLKEDGFQFHDSIIGKESNTKGSDVSRWKRRILEDFGRSSDDLNLHTLFESINKGGKEYLRALYDSEDLPRSLSVNDEHCLQLWRNCCYLDFTDVANPEVLDLNKSDWPWGNRAFEYWTWGLVLRRRSDPESCYYLLASVDGGYMNLANFQPVGRNFRAQISGLPNTPIKEREPRDFSLFIAFFRDTGSLKGLEGQIVLMSRNNELDEPRGGRSKMNTQFWTTDAT